MSWNITLGIATAESEAPAAFLRLLGRLGDRFARGPLHVLDWTLRVQQKLPGDLTLGQVQEMVEQVHQSD